MVFNKLIKKIRNKLPENRARIIIITVLADTDYVHQAFELGCEAYAAKPIDTDKLIEVMSKLGITKND
ncbi:response regulator [Acetobacterium tundrae]|uniref:Stage 0 sporulation protein A homolog n=1 Tax=Acetobacterium tundrae TaxID=132932 RepID=A0ABR6WND1_9FIRM|nr:response regulator [Acetobacterium tundrae]